jgi:Zn-ribbon-containing, possibly nucleic-acid-binding protein (DUF2310)
MNDSVDPFWKLRPQPATPEQECCACIHLSANVLLEALSHNPVVCFDCRRELAIEKTGFTADLAEPIAKWRSFYKCFYLLWLDSAEFEGFACEQLLSNTSVVNQRSLALASRLNKPLHSAAIRPTYFFWFSETDQNSTQTSCPNCGVAGRVVDSKPLCEACFVTW